MASDPAPAMLEAVLQYLACARSRLMQGRPEGEAELLSSALEIVAQLRSELDVHCDSYAANLDDIYAYVYRRIACGARHKCPAMLAEAGHLLREIHCAWVSYV